LPQNGRHIAGVVWSVCTAKRNSSKSLKSLHKAKVIKIFFFCARCATVSKVQILPACILLDVHHIKEISFHVFFLLNCISV